MPIRLKKLCLVLSLALPVGCQLEPDILEAPSLDELEAAYVEPTGAVTLNEVKKILRTLLEEPETFEAISKFRVFAPLLDEVGEAIPDDESFKLGNMELAGQASGSLQLACTSKDIESGNLTMNFTLDAGGLGPEIWGDFHDCAPGDYVQNYYQKYPYIHETLKRTRFNGSFELLLANQDSFIPDQSHWLLAYEGEIYVDDTLLFEGRIDVEREGDITTTRLPLSDGRWIFYSVDSSLVEHSLEDIDGTIACNLNERKCTSEEHPLGNFEF